MGICTKLLLLLVSQQPKRSSHRTLLRFHRCSSHLLLLLLHFLLSLKTNVLLEWVIAFTIIILNFFSCTLFRYGQRLPTCLALDSAMLSRSETLEFVHCRIFAAASNSRARPFTHFPEPPASTNVLQTRNEGNPSDCRSSGKQALDAGKKEEQRTTELQTILEVGMKTTELPASSVTAAAILSLSLFWAAFLR